MNIQKANSAQVVVVLKRLPSLLREKGALLPLFSISYISLLLAEKGGQVATHCMKASVRSVNFEYSMLPIFLSDTIFVANVGRRCAAKVGFSETRPASSPWIL
jgi:hypothetical protein